MHKMQQAPFPKAWCAHNLGGELRTLAGMPRGDCYTLQLLHLQAVMNMAAHLLGKAPGSQHVHQRRGDVLPEAAADGGCWQLVQGDARK